MRTSRTPPQLLGELGQTCAQVGDTLPELRDARVSGERRARRDEEVVGGQVLVEGVAREGEVFAVQLARTSTRRATSMRRPWCQTSTERFSGLRAGSKGG